MLRRNTILTIQPMYTHALHIRHVYIGSIARSKYLGVSFQLGRPIPSDEHHFDEIFTELNDIRKMKLLEIDRHALVVALNILEMRVSVCLPYPTSTLILRILYVPLDCEWHMYMLYLLK